MVRKTRRMPQRSGGKQGADGRVIQPCGLVKNDYPLEETRELPAADGMSVERE